MGVVDELPSFESTKIMVFLFKYGLDLSPYPFRADFSMNTT